MKRQLRFIVVFSLFAFGVGLGSAAAQPFGNGSGSSTSVEVVNVEFDGDDVSGIRITGVGFVPGDDEVLRLTLGGFEISRSDDPSAACALTVLSDPQEITCEFAPVLSLLTGDYLLTVSIGTGARKTAEYDLTIGAAGPQGAAGSAR